MNNNREKEVGSVGDSDEGVKSVDWVEVDKIDVQLGNISFSAARIELEGLAARILSEKKKLKGMVNKHGAALDEIARVRREIASERNRLFNEYNRLEGEIVNVSSRGGEYSSGEVNQLKVELTQLKKKMENKKSSHAQYLNIHVATVKKRERLVIVQTKTVINLFHRKLALGKRVFETSGGSNQNGDKRREESNMPQRTSSSRKVDNASLGAAPGKNTRTKAVQ